MQAPFVSGKETAENFMKNEVMDESGGMGGLEKVQQL